MMRFVFGALLALLVACPTLLPVIVVVISQPAVLAFAAGVILWPRLTRKVRGWTS
jgi:hypothetical protein